MIDFQKIECPFVRKEFPITQEDYRKYRRKYELRGPNVYLVTPEINPGYEWVFEDSDTIAVEKLNGTNVSISVDGYGNIEAIQNRKNAIPLLNIYKSQTHFINGIVNSIDKRYTKYCETDTLNFGELLGPKVQGNPYNLKNHIWYPFDKAVESLQYKSFHKYERTFENFSFWFKDFLPSLFYAKVFNTDLKESVFSEGVVFYNFKRRSNGQTFRAKLRRDMFDWYYPEIEIHKDCKDHAALRKKIYNQCKINY